MERLSRERIPGEDTPVVAEIEEGADDPPTGALLVVVVLFPLPVSFGGRLRDRVECCATRGVALPLAAAPC